MAVADNAAWLVILAHIGPVLLAVTTSLHIDFLRKPGVTDLWRRARLIKLGQRLAVVDVELYSRGSATWSRRPRSPTRYRPREG